MSDTKYNMKKVFRNVSFLVLVSILVITSHYVGSRRIGTRLDADVYINDVLTDEVFIFANEYNDIYVKIGGRTYLLSNNSNDVYLVDSAHRMISGLYCWTAAISLTIPGTHGDDWLPERANAEATLVFSDVLGRRVRIRYSRAALEDRQINDWWDLSDTRF